MDYLTFWSSPAGAHDHIVTRHGRLFVVGRRRVDLVTRAPVGKLAARDAEQAGRLGKIAAGPMQGQLEQSLFVQIEVEIVAQQLLVKFVFALHDLVVEPAIISKVDPCGLGLGKNGEQMVDFDMPAGGNQQHPAFDHVLQFADIARP
jgi:hypothetical protein